MKKVRTGRKGLVADSEAKTAHVDVRDFVDMITSDEPNWEDIVEQNEIAQSILYECCNTKTEGLQGSYYRARSINEGTYNTEDLHSPPDEKVKESGRYNQAGESVLYLARTCETAMKEIQPNEQDQVYIQLFEIDAPKLSYIKLETDLEQRAPHLHHLLLLSEDLPEETSTEEAYWPTHFLRHICDKLEMSAIEFPSVRAEYSENPDAVNLVVFDDAKAEVEQMTQGDPFKCK